MEWELQLCKNLQKEYYFELENSVIPEELKLLGVKKGSTIKLGSFEFIYEN